jgi:hypothetical protein
MDRAASLRSCGHALVLVIAGIDVVASEHIARLPEPQRPEGAKAST